MKIPSELKVGAHTIKVLLAPLGDNNYGDYDCETSTIRIDENLPQTMRESTLLHEALHVANSTLGGTELGHAFLDSISEQLYQILKDNNLLNEET